MELGSKATIFLYTDGAASGNPGPGGYGVVLKCEGYEKEMSGGFACTTNNRMELLAVIVGLEAVKWRNARVEVYSDSSYVVKAVNENWLENWQRRAWKKVKNVDLWYRFIEVYRRHRVTFHWLKGHAGHPENERCAQPYSHSQEGGNHQTGISACREHVYQKHGKSPKSKQKNLFQEIVFGISARNTIG